MLSQEQIFKNREEFLKLIEKIDIPYANITGLVEFLDTNGFFTAPASTQYHCAYEGGLCKHSLDVYYTFLNLINIYLPNNQYDHNTLIVCGLLHDISKVNYFEQYVQNKKVYTPDGKQFDEIGKFKWESTMSYKVKDVKDRFIGGTQGFNTFMIISRYIPLNDDETIAIVNQYCGMDDGFSNKDLNAILNKHPLTALLHSADMISTFITEKY